MVLTDSALTTVKIETSKTHIANLGVLKFKTFFKLHGKTLEEFTYYHRAMILTNSMQTFKCTK